MKNCRTCSKDIELAGFCRKSSAKDGLDSSCKNCRKESRLRKLGAATSKPIEVIASVQDLERGKGGVVVPFSDNGEVIRSSVWAYGYTKKAVLFAVHMSVVDSEANRGRWSANRTDSSVRIDSRTIGMSECADIFEPVLMKFVSHIVDDPDYIQGLGRPGCRSKSWATMNSLLKSVRDRSIGTTADLVEVICSGNEFSKMVSQLHTAN